MKWLFWFLFCLSLIGCSPGTQPVVEEKPTQPRYVGQINSTHLEDENGFVLIRRATGVTLTPGIILISRGPGERVANLRVTGENQGQMSAADLQSGVPQIGDSVYEPLLSGDGAEADFVSPRP